LTSPNPSSHVSYGVFLWRHPAARGSTQPGITAVFQMFFRVR
jgi:hypothetical protein